METWRSAAACLAAVLGVPAFAAADAAVKAVGSVFCRAVPLEGARVELMDSDCHGSEVCDDVLAIAHVDGQGRFEVAGRGGDGGGLGGNPDVYIRIAFNDDDGVRMTDEADVTRSVSTPRHDHDNTPDGTTIDFGRITVGANAGPGDTPRCQVFLALRRAYRSYVDVVDPAHQPPPAGHLDILAWSAIWAGTPWTNTDTAHWPINYSADAALHEFGHSVRHAADGSPSHFTADVMAFRYARNHANDCGENANAQPGELLNSVRSYNFNEAWADYWENDIPDCPGLMNDLIEGAQAKYLKAIEVANGLTRMDMVDVLRRNPGSIHNLDEFRDRLAEEIGMSSAALTTKVETWRTANVLTMASRERPKAYTPEEMSARQLTARRAAEAQIADRRAAASRALETGRAIRTRTCRGADCQAVFAAIVAPVLLQGEGEALGAWVALLRRAGTGTWAEDARRSRVEGRFDDWLARLRGELRDQQFKSMLKALDRVSGDLGRAREQFGPDYGPFALELADARKRCSAAARKPGREDGGCVPQLELPLDAVAIEPR
jgi:hypothetical protein